MRECCSQVARHMIPLSILTLFAGSNVQLFSDRLVEQAMNSETLARLSQDAFHVDSMLSILKVLTETALGLREIFDERLKPVVSQLAKAVASFLTNYSPSSSNSQPFKKEQGRRFAYHTSQPGSVELRWKSTVSGRRFIRARRRKS